VANLARLAVSRENHGRGTGVGMLQYAIRRKLVIPGQAGIQAILTHPIVATPAATASAAQGREEDPPVNNFHAKTSAMNGRQLSPDWPSLSPSPGVPTPNLVFLNGSRARGGRNR
jgi:hypothetical protein